MTTKRALVVAIIIFAGVSWLGHKAPVHRPAPVPKHPLHPQRRSVRRKLKLRQRQLTVPKLQLRQRKHADVRKLRRRRHHLPAPKPRSRRQKPADAKMRRRQHQARVRRYQPRQQEVTLARKQARHPPLRRQRPRLQPSRFRSAHSLSRNRQLVRPPPPPLAPRSLMPHRHQGVVTEWYG
jgi:hypothetical protein